VPSDRLQSWKLLFRKVVRMVAFSLLGLLALLAIRVMAVKWRAVGAPRPAKESVTRNEIADWLRKKSPDQGARVIGYSHIRRNVLDSGSWIEVMIHEPSLGRNNLSRYRLELDAAGRVTSAKQLAMP
jgi:hypothetical protein